MRQFCFLTSILVFAAAETSFGQCAGYPAEKTFTACFGEWSPGQSCNQLTTVNANGNVGYPGWPLESGNGGGQVILTILGNPGKPCQRDTVSNAKRKYRSDNVNTTTYPTWAVNTGDELSLSWHVYIAGPTSRMPAIKLRNGKHIRLDFMGNMFRNGRGTASVAGGVYSGWKVVEGSPSSLSGGQVIRDVDSDPAQPGTTRYLPMSMGQWHTIRVDLHSDGTFDAYIDPESGITTSRQHLFGTLTSTGSGYVQFGHTESDGVYSSDYATHCVAWGKNAEIPPPPSLAGMIDCDANPMHPSCVAPENTLDACRNGYDDDGDGQLDCDDSDCAAIAHCADTAPEFVVTSVRTMPFGEAPGGQTNVYCSVYDENGNTLDGVSIRDPLSPAVVMSPHNDNMQFGHSRYIQLNVDGRRSYRFHVFAHNGQPVSSEVTPQLFQTLPEVGYGYLIEFMRKSQRASAGIFTPMEPVFRYDKVQPNAFNVQPNLTLQDGATVLNGSGGAEFIQTFRVPGSVTQLVSARVMVQIGGGNGSFRYRLSVHEVVGNNPPLTPADLGPQIGAARESPLIVLDAAAWQDQIVVWPVSGVDAVTVVPGHTYALKIVRVDTGLGSPSFNIIRSSSNYAWDPPFGNPDFAQLYRFDGANYVLDAGGFDARAYVVGGAFGPVTQCSPFPVFDRTGEIVPNVPDSRVDSFDFVIFADCATGADIDSGTFQALSQTCRCMDIDQDEDVDMDDYGWFQRCYTGSLGIADPACHPFVP